MTEHYRKILEDADAARAAETQRQMAEEQKRQAAVGQASQRAKAWYDEVFLKEMTRANEQIATLNAKFVVERMQPGHGGMVASFRFVRHQRPSDHYHLHVDGETFALSQHRETAPPGQRAGVRVVSQRPHTTAMNLPGMEKSKRLHLGNDDPVVAEMLAYIIQQNVR